MNAKTLFPLFLFLSLSLCAFSFEDDEYFGGNFRGEESNGYDYSQYSEWFKNDYYGALGVSSSASGKTIKSAYRTLSMRYHPDSQSGNKDRFLEIRDAYEVLKNEEKRGEYDDFIASVPAQFRPKYGHVPVAVWKVLVVFCIVVSVFQWVFKRRHALIVREYAMETQRYKMALEQAKARGEDPSTIEIDVVGAQFPKLHELLFIQIAMAFTYYPIFKIYDAIRWKIRYGIMGKELSEEDRETLELHSVSTTFSVEEVRRLKQMEKERGRRIEKISMPEHYDDYDFDE